MKAPLITALGILAIAAIHPASAADMGPPLAAKAPPPVPVPVFTWTGFYIGGNFGGGWASNDFSNTLTGTAAGIPFPTATNSGTAAASGILGGGQIGFNYEFPTNWVVGIEADIDADHIAGSGSGCLSTAAGVVSSCGHDSSVGDYFGTVRGRVGYAFDNLLFYGTGGWAYAESTTTHTTTCVSGACPATSLPFTFNSPSVSTTASGWTAGAGIEWGFLPNWTLRAEYLHLQFNGVGENFGFTGTTIGIPIVSNVHNTRVGVSYLFNWGPRY